MQRSIDSIYPYFNIMNITVKQLEAAVTVAERGNFTRAAEVLGTTQPALSLQIRELEEALGLRLFDRTTRRVEPTRAGMEFVRSVKKILGDLDHAVSKTAEIANRQRGRISIAAPPLLAAVVLPATIRQFRAEFPGIDIVLADVSSDKIVERVMTGEADLGLGTFVTREPALTSMPLLKDALTLFYPTGSPFAGEGPIAWGQLKDALHITLSRESGIRFLVDHGCELAGFTARIAHEVTQMSTALALVEAGLGVSILPTYAFAIARQLNVGARPLIDPVLTREISLVRSSERSVPPGADVFSRMLGRQVQLLVPEAFSIRQSGDDEG